MARKTDIVCTNIFKSQDQKELRREFLKRWAAIINHLERVKTPTGEFGKREVQ